MNLQKVYNYKGELLTMHRSVSDGIPQILDSVVTSSAPLQNLI